MSIHPVAIAVFGVVVGTAAAFFGLGGGFLIVPLLMVVGFSGDRAVGTSVLAIVIMSASALAAHSRLGNVDFRLGLLLGIGGMVGAQVGARVVEAVPPDSFRKLFALVLVGLAAYLVWKK